MGQIKINNIIYGTTSAAEILYNDITVKEKLDTIPVFDINDNSNVSPSSDYLTYGNIIDNLSSNATDKVLSANQGRVLKESIENIDFSPLEVAISDNTEDIDNLNNNLEIISNEVSANKEAIIDLNSQVTINTNSINNNLISCKYNTETDYISILLNGVWIDVIHAGAIDPQPLIPVLTADGSAGIGLASCGNNYNKSAAYVVFDGNDSTRTEYSTENVSNGWIMYSFNSTVEIKKVMMRALSVGKIFDYHFQYWDNDLATWVNFADGQSSFYSSDESKKETITHTVPKTIITNKVKMYTTTTKSSGNNLYLYTIQVYGRYL